MAAVEAAGAAGDERIDAGGRCVIPGFVDSHTHLVFAGDRADEFAARMAGTPYEAGGIRVTTEATRAAGPERLLALAQARREEARRAGITHARDQVRLRPRRRDRAALLRDRRRADRRRHVPRRARRPGRVRRSRGRLRRSRLWRDARRRARRTRAGSTSSASGARSTPTSRAPCSTAGRAAGSGCDVHGNQLGPGPGVSSPSSWAPPPSTTARTSPTPTSTRSPASDTVATFLPATDFSTRQPYPDARRAIDAGVRGRARHELQPRLELHDVDGVLHRARRARHADDRSEEALAGGHARRRRSAPRRHRSPRARRPRRRRLLDAPCYAHLVYRPGVPLVAATIVGGSQRVKLYEALPACARTRRQRHA